MKRLEETKEIRRDEKVLWRLDKTTQRLDKTRIG